MFLLVISYLLITNTTPTSDNTNKPYKRNNIRRNCNIFKQRNIQTRTIPVFSISQRLKDYQCCMKIFKKCFDFFQLSKKELKKSEITETKLQNKNISNHKCKSLNDIYIDINCKQTDFGHTQSCKAIFMKEKECIDENQFRSKQPRKLYGVIETSLFQTPKEQLIMNRLRSDHIYFSKEIEKLEKIHNDYISNFNFTKSPELKAILLTKIQSLKDYISNVRSLLVQLSDFIQQISKIDILSDFTSLTLIPQNEPCNRSDHFQTKDDFYYCYYLNKIHYKEIDISNNRVKIKSSLSLIKQVKVKQQNLDFSDLHLKKKECYLRTLLQLVFETTDIQIQILIDEQIVQDYKKMFSMYKQKRQIQLQKVKRKNIHKGIIREIIDKIKDYFGSKPEKNYVNK